MDLQINNLFARPTWAATNLRNLILKYGRIGVLMLKAERHTNRFEKATGLKIKLNIRGKS